RARELGRQAEAVDGQHLVESFEDAGGNTRRLVLESAGEIAQQSLGFIGLIEFPCLPQRPAYRCMQRLRQPLDHVARAATPGASCSNLRARLRNNRSALSASSSSHACRSAL